MTEARLARGPAPGDRRAPGAPQCRFCGAPLSPHQAVRGVCGAPECEARRVQEAARAVFRRDWAAHVATQRHGIEHAAGDIAAAVRELGKQPDEIAFGVVPRQDGAVMALPQARRAAFAAHLREITAESVARGAAPAVDPTRRAASERAEAPVLDAACATCQGKCCLLGGATHAFLDAATIDLYRARHPQASAPEIVEHYLARLPDASVEHSCVYHGDRGCVLPRRERSDVCNRYHCNPQMDLLRRFRESPAGAAVIVAVHGEAGPAVAAFDEAGRRVLPPGSGQGTAPALVERVVAVAMAQMPAALTGEAPVEMPAEIPPAPAAAPDSTGTGR